MSAARLREAAALMRKRAEKARTGDIVLGDFWAHDLMWMSTRYDVTTVDEGTVIADNLDRWTAEHIAGFGPAVALAVADWLEATAREFDALGDPSLEGHPRDGRRTAALAVANTYLGSDQ